MPAANRALVAGLVLAGALLPVVFAVAFPAKGEATSGSFPTEDDYAVFADQFARTGALRDETGALTAKREPVYPVLLGLGFKLFGARYATEVAVNAALNAGLVYAIFVVGKALFGDGVGRLSAAIAAFYPSFIYYAAHPRRETLLCLLSVASIGALVWAWRRGRAGGFAAAGLVNALAALSNTTFLPFGLLAAPAGLLWLSRRRLGRGLAFAAVYCAVFALAYLPWPARNYAVFHRLIAGTAGAGGSVFYINQRVPPELGGLAQERAIIASDPVEAQAGQLDPITRDRLFWKAGLALVKQDPGRFAGIFLHRFFVEEWRVAPRPRGYEQSYGLVRLAALLSDGWLIPLGLFGLLFLWRAAPPGSVWIGLFIVFYNGVYAAIFSMLRYRLPVMPWVILFAAVTIARINKLRAERVK